MQRKLEKVLAGHTMIFQNPMIEKAIIIIIVQQYKKLPCSILSEHRIMITRITVSDNKIYIQQAEHMIW